MTKQAGGLTSGSMNQDNLFGGVDVADAVSRLREKKGPVLPKGGGKFKVSPKEARTLNGRTYDSKLEMKMHEELLRHFPEEEIRTQVRFELQPAFCLDHAPDRQRALVYKADFVLGPVDGTPELPRPGVGSMVLDAKGMVLSSFVVSAKLFEYKFRVPVYAAQNMKQLRTYIETYKAMENVDKELLTVLTSGRPFWVTGYTNSEGVTSDLRVEVVGREGYRSLVMKSIIALNLWEVEKHADGSLSVFNGAEDLIFKVPAAEEALFTQAYTKMQDSLVKRGEAVEEEAASRQTREVYQALDPDVGMIDNDPTKIAALRLRVTNRLIMVGEEKPAPVKKASVTSWRKAIEDKLPIGEYVHRLNLYPGKYQEVKPA